MKIKKLLGFTIILLIVFSFIGCPDPETEYVYVEVVKPDDTLVFRAESKPVTFGNKESVRIEGTLTATEWNGVPEKVRAALEAAYSQATDKMPLTAVFSRTGFTIIVTKGIDGTYRANNGFVLYISLDKLESADLIAKIIDAANKLDSSSYPAVGQVKKQNRVRFGGGMSPFELV